ncbi:BlaI/MecI/CopY family transcriptional regulator [Natronogracilivirga saccharolytica]|uniref:BlaI/MecI/CopY family transcriptional regulator n=1 Tax=Natronogracilivirga saccharolytica TaxID=2812953 RepID=A0A8J7RKD4_9BACT|nr:BlaI/MecI/CopY family transcriptional regulator [Natronogracilivirga saccharolytica]MBP3193330.1 BlaI/MecI/CopY family transcriptional regulator [Natronogracilivirga saccharolytica]
MKKSLIPLGETEMEILHHVWKLEKATVAQVQERILEDRKVAYTTIMTIMKNLSDKGLLDKELQGNTYVYRPAQPAGEVQQNLVRQFVDKVFKGSPAALVQSLVKAEKLSPEDREEIERLIGKMK